MLQSSWGPDRTEGSDRGLPPVPNLSGGFRFVDLFAGIGGMRLAGERAGGTCVFTSEIDAACKRMYEAYFGDMPTGDITEVPPAEVPDHEVLFAGFPCQPFSIIGEQRGFADTRGTLFFNIEAILSAKRPPAFLLENVKQLRSHDHGRTFATIIKHLTGLGYYVYSAILNALDFGLPQKRERTLIVGFSQPLEFHWPNPVEKRARLDDFLEPDHQVPERFFASERIQLARLEKLDRSAPVPGIWHENKSGHISALPYSVALRAGASYNYILVNGRRRPTPRELLRLQGFPDDMEIVVTDSEARKQAGNAVPVPMIEAVARQLVEATSKRLTATAAFAEQMPMNDLGREPVRGT